MALTRGRPFGRVLGKVSNIKFDFLYGHLCPEWRPFLSLPLSILFPSFTIKSNDTKHPFVPPTLSFVFHTGIALSFVKELWEGEDRPPPGECGVQCAVRCRTRSWFHATLCNCGGFFGSPRFAHGEHACLSHLIRPDPTKHLPPPVSLILSAAAEPETKKPKQRKRRSGKNEQADISVSN